MAGKPTPETDLDHARSVREAVTRQPEKLPVREEGLQKIADKEGEQGFRGTEVDPTDNKAYTVAGVTSEQPTPETDAKAAKVAREATGVGLSGIESAAREKSKGE